ncbi:MAG: MarR family transcriptional regulator [Chloroflexi bacterium]|nr:MarR family transcriptional regulator [Chloroflexota bacterium]
MNRDQAIAEILKLIPVLRRIPRPRAMDGWPAHDFPLVQVWALMLLAQEGSKTVGEVAQGVGVSCPAATELVDRLEQRGAVQRVRSPQDRRKVLVQLTPKHAEVIRAAVAERRDRVASALEQLTSQEQESLVRGLRLIVRALAEPYRERVASP